MIWATSASTTIRRKSITIADILQHRQRFSRKLICKRNCAAAYVSYAFSVLTSWGWVTHICVGNQAIIGSDNGLSPGRCQAIIWTDTGILLIGPLRTNFSEIWIGIQTFSLKKIHLKIASAKWRLFCLGSNVLSWLSDGIGRVQLYSQYSFH